MSASPSVYSVTNSWLVQKEDKKIKALLEKKQTSSTYPSTLIDTPGDGV